MANKKLEEPAQLLMFRTGDLDEMRELHGLAEQNLQSCKLLADGLRRTMNEERIAVGNAIKDLKATLADLQQLATRIAGVVAELKDEEQVEFVDLDAEFVPVDQPTQGD